MAQRFWVGGTASWNGVAGAKWAVLSGGAGGAAEPTAADDVFFDAASGAVVVTIDTANAVCNNLNCTGFTGTLGGNTTNLTISGSLTLVAGMTMSYFGGVLTFDGAGANTITSGGKNIDASSIVWNGNGSWTLQDAMTGAGSGTLTKGTLDLNTKTLTIANLTISGATARTLSCNGAQITLSNSATVWDATTTTNLTFNGATSSITITNPGAPQTFAGGDLTYGTVAVSGSSTFTIQGNNTFTNLQLTGSLFPVFTAATTQTVNGVLTVTGTDSANRVLCASSAVGSVATISAAGKALTDVDFMDITAAGAASPFSGTRIGNCKGNTNITFTVAANKFWVGNTANSNTANWATVSGGAGATANYPLPQDTIVFDANSFSANGQTITFNNGSCNRIGSILCSSTDQTFTIAMAATICTVYGDITFDANTTLTQTGGSQTFSGRNTQIINCAGKNWGSNGIGWTIDSLGGTFSLGANFTTGSTSVLTLLRGTLDLNGKTVSTGTFSSSNANARTVKSSVSGGVLALATTASTNIVSCATVTNLTLDRATGTWAVTIGGNTTNLRAFSTGNVSWPSVTFTCTTAGGRLDFSGSSCTLKSLAYTGGAATTIRFTAGNTYTFEDDNGFPSGTAGNTLTITSGSAANHNLVKSGGGTINCSNMSISRSQATPAGPTPKVWFAGATSTNGGNNSGWWFEDAVATVFDGSGARKLNRRGKRPEPRVTVKRAKLHPEEIARQQREDERYLKTLEKQKTVEPVDLQRHGDTIVITKAAEEPSTILTDAMLRAASDKELLDIIAGMKASLDDRRRATEVRQQRRRVAAAAVMLAID